jgi:hypothetical protein
MIEYVHRRKTEKNITPANISLDITNVVLVPLKIICSYVQDFNNITQSTRNKLELFGVKLKQDCSKSIFKKKKIHILTDRLYCRVYFLRELRETLFLIKNLI